MEKVDWNEWLMTMETTLKEAGYRKFTGHHKREDFGYWKSVYDGEKKLYQIAVLFYDFRKFSDQLQGADRIGYQYECMLIGDSRFDLSVSKDDMDFKEFEKVARDFHNAMVVHLL